MNCEEWFEQLYQILDKDVDDVFWREVEEHMKQCRPCWDRLEFEKRLKERIHKVCLEEPCGESVRTRVKALLEKY